MLRHRAGEQLELVRRGRGADENELVAAGRLERSSVGVLTDMGAFDLSAHALFVTVGHSRPGRGVTGWLAGQRVAAGSRSSVGCRHRVKWSALTAAGGHACGCDRAGSGVQARWLTGAAAANTEAIRAIAAHGRCAHASRRACGLLPMQESAFELGRRNWPRAGCCRPGRARSSPAAAKGLCLAWFYLLSIWSWL